MKALCLFSSLVLYFYTSSATANTLTCYEIFATTPVQSKVRDLLRAHQFPQALVAAQQIIEKSPLAPQGYGLKAQAQLGLKDFDGALKSAQETLRLQVSNPKNLVLPLQMIASAQMGLGRFEDVIMTADLILKTNPKNRVAIEFLARASAALGHKERTQDVQNFLSKRTLRNLIQKARTQVTQHQYKEAIVTLREILKIDPLNPYAAGLLTNSYIKLNQLKEALQALKQELELNPKNAVAQGLKIRIFLIQQKGTEALALAEQLSPQDPYKHFYVASALIELKNYKQALTVLNETPQPTLDILWKKAQAYYHLGDRLQSRQALIQIIQNAPTVDYRALATLLRLDSEGTAAPDGLGDRIVATLSDSQKISLMDWMTTLEGKHLWTYVPAIPRVVVSKSLVNNFWLGIHNLPVDGQTFRSTK